MWLSGLYLFALLRPYLDVRVLQSQPPCLPRDQDFLDLWLLGPSFLAPGIPAASLALYLLALVLTLHMEAA